MVIGLCLFLTERTDGGAVEGSMFGSTSAHGLVLSKNLLDSKHPFFMFSSREILDGKINYQAYNRFPVIPFFLIGIVINPFEDNTTLQFYMARQLMNLFFFLSLIVVFNIVSEIVKNTYIALSIAVISFSSYYMLTYNNMIFNDIPALLGFVVALSCIVQAQKNKLNVYKFIFYALFPISLGWQAFAVYMSWFVLDAVETIFSKKKIKLRNKVPNIFKQMSFKITLVSITWGIIILGLQLLNEWIIVGGSFWRIPTVYSAIWRSGLDSAVGHTQFVWVFDWFTFIPAQAHSMTIMLIPFWPIFQVEPGINASIFVVLLVMIYTVLRYLSNKNSENKILLIFILSGFFWAIPMRHFVALHEFQSIFYLGFTIGVYLILFSRPNLYNGKLLVLNITLLFLICAALSNHMKTSNLGPDSITNQFKFISEKLPKGSKVFLDENRNGMTGFKKYAIDLFLRDHFYSQFKDADYIITRNSEFESLSLTKNKDYNLFKLNDKAKVPMTQ
jgi:hypothetical protein